MNTETADAILVHHNGLRSWRQPFMFATPHGLVDLSVFDKATTPKNVSQYQPIDYPNWPRSLPVYWFDPDSYCGDDNETKLIYGVKRDLIGVNFFLNNIYDTTLYHNIRLICSFSKTLSKTMLYKDKCFMKADTKVEPLKVRGSATFDQLDNPKSKRAKTVDQKHGKQKHVDKDTVCALPRTTAHCVICSSDNYNVVVMYVAS